MPEAPQDPKEWIRQSIIDETQQEIRRRMERRSCIGGRSWRITFACAVIAFGVLLFLGNIGVLPSYNLWQFWPVIPVAAGIGRLSSPHRAARVWGVFLIVIGGLFLGVNLGWIRIQTQDGSWIFSIILIGVGLLALFNVFDPVRGAMTAAARASSTWKLHNANPDKVLGDLTVLGALKRRVETTNFQGGELIAILGNIDIDLRRAAITGPENTAVLSANAILGAVKIRVPEHWRVHVQGVSVLGNFEDKTVPPNTGLNAPTLIVGGWSFMGAVEIED